MGYGFTVYEAYVCPLGTEEPETRPPSPQGCSWRDMAAHGRQDRDSTFSRAIQLTVSRYGGSRMDRFCRTPTSVKPVLLYWSIPCSRAANPVQRYSATDSARSFVSCQIGRTVSIAGQPVISVTAVSRTGSPQWHIALAAAGPWPECARLRDLSR